jgi:hypothetical protein
MRTLSRQWPTREGRWRKPAIVAASVGLHAAVVGFMAFNEGMERRRYGEEPRFQDPWQGPIVYLDLRPRRPPSPIDADRQAASTETNAGQASPAAPIPPSPRFTDEIGAESAPGSSGVETSVWQARPETTGDRVERGLRTSTLGCANAQFLSVPERDACDQRFGARAELAGPVHRAQPSAAEEGFARQAAANDAWRAYKEGEGAYPGLRSLFTER